MSKVIRFILTLALIYGAYTETGVITALSLLLIFVAIELNGCRTKRGADGWIAPEPPRKTIKLTRLFTRRSRKPLEGYHAK